MGVRAVFKIPLKTDEQVHKNVLEIGHQIQQKLKC